MKGGVPCNSKNKKVLFLKICKLPNRLLFLKAIKMSASACIIKEFEKVNFDKKIHAYCEDHLSNLQAQPLSDAEFEKIVGISWTEFRENPESQLVRNLSTKYLYLPKDAQRMEISRKQSVISGDYQNWIHFNVVVAVKFADGIRFALSDGKNRTLSGLENGFEEFQCNILEYRADQNLQQIFSTLNTNGTNCSKQKNKEILCKVPNTVNAKIESILEDTDYLKENMTSARTACVEMYEKLAECLFYRITKVQNKELACSDFQRYISDINSAYFEYLVGELSSAIEIVEYVLSQVDDLERYIIIQKKLASTITGIMSAYLYSNLSVEVAKKNIDQIFKNNRVLKFANKKTEIPISRINTVLDAVKDGAFYTNGTGLVKALYSVFMKTLFTPSNYHDNKIGVYKSDVISGNKKLPEETELAKKKRTTLPKSTVNSNYKIIFTTK